MNSNDPVEHENPQRFHVNGQNDNDDNVSPEPLANENRTDDNTKVGTSREPDAVEPQVPPENATENIQSPSRQLHTTDTQNADFYSKTDTNSSKRTYEEFDPDSIQPEIKKTRIAGKIIDKFWEPLDITTMNALDKIIDLSLDKAIERYKTSSNEKRFAAEKLLHQTWALDVDSKSFKSRLKLTKLPKLGTMHSSSSNKTDENKYILNYDVLSRRKLFLETYLLAELKQLKQLQTYYNTCKSNYTSDANYLKEFEKTVAINQQKMAQDIEHKQAELSIDFNNGSRENSTTKTAELVDGISIGTGVHNDVDSFVPNADDDINELLTSLNDNLCKLTSNSKVLLDFNERLERFQNNIDMH